MTFLNEILLCKPYNTFTAMLALAPTLMLSQLTPTHFLIPFRLLVHIQPYANAKMLSTWPKLYTYNFSRFFQISYCNIIQGLWF